MQPDTLIRGDTYIRGWTFTNKSVVPNVPLNLTGATIKIDIRDSTDTLVVRYTLADTNNLTLDLPTALLKLEIPAILTKTLIIGASYLYDIEVTLSTGFVFTAIQVKLKILKDYTYA